MTQPLRPKRPLSPPPNLSSQQGSDPENSPKQAKGELELFSLPNELIYHTASFLDISTVSQLTHVNQFFRGLANEACLPRIKPHLRGKGNEVKLYQNPANRLQAYLFDDKEGVEYLKSFRILLPVLFNPIHAGTLLVEECVSTMNARNAEIQSFLGDADIPMPQKWNLQDPVVRLLTVSGVFTVSFARGLTPEQLSILNNKNRPVIRDYLGQGILTQQDLAVMDDFDADFLSSPAGQTYIGAGALTAQQLIGLEEEEHFILQQPGVQKYICSGFLPFATALGLVDPTPEVLGHRFLQQHMAGLGAALTLEEVCAITYDQLEYLRDPAVREQILAGDLPVRQALQEAPESVVEPGNASSTESFESDEEMPDAEISPSGSDYLSEPD